MVKIGWKRIKLVESVELVESVCQFPSSPVYQGYRLSVVRFESASVMRQTTRLTVTGKPFPVSKPFNEIRTIIRLNQLNRELNYPKFFMLNLLAFTLLDVLIIINS